MAEALLTSSVLARCDFRAWAPISPSTEPGDPEDNAQAWTTINAPHACAAANNRPRTHEHAPPARDMSTRRAVDGDRMPDVQVAADRMPMGYRYPRPCVAGMAGVTMNFLARRAAGPGEFDLRSSTHTLSLLPLAGAQPLLDGQLDTETTSFAMQPGLAFLRPALRRFPGVEPRHGNVPLLQCCRSSPS